MIKRLLLFTLLTLFVLPVMGQGAPEPINDALDDLNERLGTNLTLNDFNWSWSQVAYDNGALGCEESVETFTPDPVVGYNFIFEIGENTYDYRVSADRTIVVLCSVTNINDVDPEVTETPEPLIGEDAEDPYSNPLCGEPPTDISYMPTRLTTEIRGYVTPGLPVNIRTQPATTATATGQLPGDTEFFVVSGPECDAEGFIWWQVEANETTGWIAEGRDGEYFVEPLPGDALASNYPVLTTDNALTLSEISRLQGNFGDSIAFSADNLYVTIPGGFGAEGVLLYDTTELDAGVRSIPAAESLTDVAYGQQANLALFGDANGGVRLWNITPDARLVERAFLNGHDDDVVTVFNPAGSLIASVGGMARLGPEIEDNQNGIIVWDVETVAQVVGLLGHSDGVTGLTFDDTGTVLSSVSLDGTLRFWNLDTGLASAVIEIGGTLNAIADQPGTDYVVVGSEDGTLTMTTSAQNTAFEITTNSPVNAVTFTPDGTFLLSAHENGAVNVWTIDADAGTFAQVTSLLGHTGPVLDVAVSPHGLVFASIGEDNLAILWAVGSNSFG